MAYDAVPDPNEVRDLESTNLMSFQVLSDTDFSNIVNDTKDPNTWEGKVDG